jgi:hypothetical protein
MSNGDKKELMKKVDRTMFYALKIKGETQTHVEAVKEVKEAIASIPADKDSNRALHYALEMYKSGKNNVFQSCVTIAIQMMDEAASIAVVPSQTTPPTP